MLLRFTKMHGLGNDFMVIDLVSQHAHIQPKHAKQWGDRHTGVGFDQLLIVEPPQDPGIRMWIFATASSTPTVRKWSNAATARAASPASWSTSA